MRASVDAKAFIQALDKVSGLIRKSAIRALEAVLVRFEKDRCTLTSTNLDTYLSVELPAQCDNFAFLLGRPRETARAFRQLEGQLALEQIETGGGQTKLALSCGPRSAVLHTFPPEDFPEQPKWEAKHTFTANAAELCARVERVKYAVGFPTKEDSRACRSSVQFSGNRIYALDGYRLAWDTDPELDVPVPFMAAPNALEHLKLFGNQMVSMQMGERFAKATDGTMTLLFRLPEGELFNMDSAIPASFQTQFHVCPKEFLGELDYLKRALRGKNHHLVRFSGGNLQAESQGERYATKVQVDGDGNVTFGFTLAYMVDALEQFKKEPFVNMKISRGSISPIILEAEGRNDHAMVLPVRLRDSAAAA